MPRTSEKAVLNEKYDKRVKIPKREHPMIVEKYRSGGYTYQQIADEYGVSKKIITLIVNPERKQKQDWHKYYDKEKRREYTKRYRQRKEELYKKGLINLRG